MYCACARSPAERSARSVTGGSPAVARCWFIAAMPSPCVPHTGPDDGQACLQVLASALHAARAAARAWRAVARHVRRSAWVVGQAALAAAKRAGMP